METNLLFVTGDQLLSCLPRFATPWTAARQAFVTFCIFNASCITKSMFEHCVRLKGKNAFTGSFCHLQENFLQRVFSTVALALRRTEQNACVSGQWCLTLSDFMDCSPPGSSVIGILQARTMEWVAISSSRGSSPPRDGTWVSCIAGRFFTI